jgi:hypothetical protein
MASEHHYHVDEDTFLEMKDRAEIAEADETERVGNRVVAAIAADERRLSPKQLSRVVRNSISLT